MPEGKRKREGRVRETEGDRTPGGGRVYVYLSHILLLALCQMSFFRSLLCSDLSAPGTAYRRTQLPLCKRMEIAFRLVGGTTADQTDNSKAPPPSLWVMCDYGIGY